LIKKVEWWSLGSASRYRSKVRREQESFFFDQIIYQKNLQNVVVVGVNIAIVGAFV